VPPRGMNCVLLSLKTVLFINFFVALIFSGFNSVFKSKEELFLSTFRKKAVMEGKIIYNRLVEVSFKVISYYGTQMF